MHLKSLQISGFKSFPEKILLNFEKGITACVGPNGSGKSNVGDAVRWVLGEQAASTLRIKTMEDIIWNGTSHRRAAGMAEVIMTFDNADRRLQNDADEVAVCRRYYRSGQSEYRINGKQVRLRDINELFMDTGLGRDGYSLVGQGKIADILDARAGDRRAIFEEASGISKYRYRKQEAERNFQKADDNLVHLEVILSGLEERVGPLEKEAEKARKYLRIWEEKKGLEIGLWLSTLETTTDQLRDQGYKITLAETERDKASQEIDESDEKIENLSGENNALLVKKDNLLREAASLEERAAELEGEANLRGNDVMHADQEIIRIKAEMDLTKQGGKGLSSRIDEKVNQKEILLDEVKILDESISSAEKNLTGLTLDEDGAAGAMAELSAEQSKLAAECAELRLRLTRADSQISEISEREGRSGEVLASLKSRTEEALSEEAKSLEAAEDAGDRIASLENTIGGYKLRLEKQTARLDAEKLGCGELRREADDKRRRSKMLEDLEKNLEGYGHSVKRISERAKDGTLRGIHGPVSRLLQAPDEYSLAIETALGGAMQHIVVDGEEDAKRAIALLKRENAGRATFLPIANIKPRNLREQGLDSCAGYIGIAAELVKCDKKYSDIITNLLGQVAVAEDIDSAAAIARRYGYKFRLVTLDGQVINAGGSFTGGARQHGAGLLSRRKELDALIRDAEKLEDQAKEREAALSELKSKADESQAALIGAEGEIAAAKEDRLTFEADARLHKQQAEGFRAQMDEIISDGESSATRKESLIKEIEEINNHISSREEKLKQIENEMTGRVAERQKISGQRNSLSDEIAALGMRRLSLEKDIQSLEISVAELKEQLEAGSGRVAGQEQMLLDLSQKKETLTAESEDLRNQSTECRINAATSREGVAGVEQGREEIEKQVSALQKSAREALERREGHSREIVRMEERRQQTVREQDSIILKLQDEYNLTRREAAEQYAPAEDEKETARQVGSLRNKIKALGPVNQGAIEEYAEVHEKYITYKTQMDDVKKSKAELQKLIDDLTAGMKQEFMKSFADIAKHFSKIFPELYGGGGAQIYLEDPDNCLECGIGMTITQPGKGPQSNIESFSGGEKAIIAVSIYFAIMKVNPAPFCVLDEIDSALDERNVVNIAAYIARMCETTQYVVITHRRGTMEAANRLYGVTKREGESKVIELNVDEIEKELKLES